MICIMRIIARHEFGKELYICAYASRQMAEAHAPRHLERLRVKEDEEWRDHIEVEYEMMEFVA